MSLTFIELAQVKIRRLKVPGYGDDEVGFMAETVQMLEPEVIYEWGTNRGSSARIFYELTRMLKLSCEIVTCELPDEGLHRDHPGVFLGMNLGRAKVTQLTGDGVTECFKYASEHGYKKKVLFFVDGDHEFESVSRELDLITRGMPYAWILLHDTRIPDVRRARFRTGGRYTPTELRSQAGMDRLVPL